MKLSTMLLGVAMNVFWAVPASALHFDEDVKLLIAFPDGLQEVWPEALWFTEVDDEFKLFDAHLWQTEVTLKNASFLPNAGTLAINIYDAASAQLASITSFGFTMQSSGTHYIIDIDSTDRFVINILINNLGILFPGARAFGIMPLVVAEPCTVSDEQPVEIEACHVYDGTVVACDEVAIPPGIACP